MNRELRKNKRRECKKIELSKKIQEKSSALEDNNDGFVNILAKELTKKVQKKTANIPHSKELKEPRIITMKATPSGSDTDKPSSPAHSTFSDDQSTSTMFASAIDEAMSVVSTTADEAASVVSIAADELASDIPTTAGYVMSTTADEFASVISTTIDDVASIVSTTDNKSDYITIERGGRMFTVPKPLKPSEYNLILPVDNHSKEKIGNIQVLRRMLKQPKVRLSNGVQISIPSTSSALYECDHCGKMFRAKQDLVKHMLIHLDQRPHPCPTCPARFRQRGNLRTHMSRVHAATLPAPQLFVCHHCDARFYVKQSMRNHLLKHEPTRAFSCQDCSKCFSRATLLNKHRRTHHGAPRFYCYLCSASYPTRPTLDAHIKRHLNTTNELICSVCGELLPGMSSMKRHMEVCHYQTKRFQCPICSKQLRGHLREHLRTHASSKPYACLECGKRFAQTSQLAVHKRSHSGLKPYVCRVCKRPFSYSNALILHIRIHTGEKPFKCAMCPQSFSQLPHMKSHMLNIHNKREAYKCNNCGEFFKLRTNLEVHQAACPRAATWLADLPERASSHDTPHMSLSKMRFLLAVLLQTIADQHRLHLLGFNKRLIDELLIDSLQATGHTPVTDPRVPPAVRLRDNIQLLLNWTVPPDVMERYKQQNKTTEQLLEELTS